MPTNNIKILILEDNESDADLLQRELHKAGIIFSAQVVQSRKEFESALTTFDPDIILSDYNLPAFDGVTAFRIKQKICPQKPFIIVSGTIGEENAVDLIKNGVTDYALKDKLFALPQKIIRALKETEDLKAKKESDDKIKIQHKKLLEIAFMQSHQVRIPVAQILDLANMFEFDNTSSPINNEILSKLKAASESLDKLIEDIIKKTNKITSAVKQS